MPCIGITGEVSESKQFEWKIADVLSLSTKKNSFYKSPSFVFENTSLHLFFYPGGGSNSESGFLSLFLANESDSPLHVNCMLYIKKADGTLIGGKGSDVSIETDRGYFNFYDRSHLEQNKSEFLPSDILTIVCILKHIEDRNPPTVKTETVEMSASETSDYRRLTELDVLSENLRDVFTNKDNCDVVLEVEEKEFKAHKTILIARSAVFAAMFQHDTLEKQTGIIKIPDCDSESFQEFLDYLYSGKLEDVSFRSAFHLYSTSKKYDIQELKEFCIEYLIKSLSVANVCDTAKLADRYDETKLITKIQDFFNRNWCKIFPTAEWENFMTNNTLLANKLLVELSKSKSSQ